MLEVNDWDTILDREVIYFEVPKMSTAFIVVDRAGLALSHLAHKGVPSIGFAEYDRSRAITYQTREGADRGANIYGGASCPEPPCYKPPMLSPNEVERMGRLALRSSPPRLFIVKR